MDCSSLREGLDNHLAHHASFNPVLAPLMPTCQKALGILDWDSMGPLLKNAIIGISDVCAKVSPNKEELLKIVHYSTAVANYAVLWKSDSVPDKGLLEKGKSSLKTIEPLIGPNLEKQKTGVDSLLKLYSQLESVLDSTAKLANLGSSAALIWEAFRARQQLRESLITLGDEVSHVLTMMDDFGARSSYMSIHLEAYLLDPAIQRLTSAYKKLNEDIRKTALIDKLQPNNIPERIEMLQNSVLTATGVSEQKKQVELDNEQAKPGKKQDEDWEAV